MVSKTQQRHHLRGYITIATPGAEAVSIKDAATRQTTTVDVSPEAGRYLHRICPALPYLPYLKDGKLHAWVPSLAAGPELTRFLSYCGLPKVPKASLDRIDPTAVVVDPTAALDPLVLTPEVSDRIARWLPAGFATLAEHLAKLKASARDIYQIHAALVARPVEPAQYLTWLKAHAFELLETEAVSAGFALLDQLTRGCSDTTRIAGAVTAVIVGGERNGNTATPWGGVTVQAAKLLGYGENTDPVHAYLRDQASKTPQTPKRFWIIRGPSTTPGKQGQLFVAREPTSLCEYHAAAGIVDQQTRRLTKRLRVTLPEPLALDQEAVVSAIRKHRIVVVTGAAGTGKTHLVRSIGDAMTAAGHEVAWTATTGRAARVLHEGGTTLHAFLGIQPGAPHHRLERRVELLVVDETSMLDTWLAGPLGSYLSAGLAERVVLIGDPFQLPPVGAGKVLSELRDLAGGFLVRSQVAELTTIRRTDEAGILSVASAIREHRPLPDLDDTPGISVYPANKSALSKIVALAQDRPEGTLVVAPRKDGPLGVRALNVALRDAHLGPSPDMWLEGMRVIQRKTARLEDQENLIVPNGTFGTVTSITPKAVTVTYEDGAEVPWEHHKCASEEGVLAPAYALTVHRAQGSQASRVVVVASPATPDAWDPAMGYTAVTRAVDELVVIGDPALLRGDQGKTINKRTTLLVQRMTQYRAKPQSMKGAS